MEIIPNWHPAIVHFPIALTITVALLLLASRWRPAHVTLLACARILLPLAAVSALLAVVFGWQAFLTVEHDAAGHAVMLRHRDWATACTIALLAVAIGDGWRQRAGHALSGAMLPVMLALSAGLVFVGWLGGEMVYRHGLGVSASAFASPAVQAEPVAPLETAVLPTAISEPALAPVATGIGGEHIHKDGKHHHH